MARCMGTGSSAYPKAWQGKEKGLTAESSPGGKATRWRGGRSSGVPRGLRPTRLRERSCGVPALKPSCRASRCCGTCVPPSWDGAQGQVMVAGRDLSSQEPDFVGVRAVVQPREAAGMLGTAGPIPTWFHQLLQQCSGAGFFRRASGSRARDTLPLSEK